MLEALVFVVLIAAAYRITRFFVIDSLIGFSTDSGSRMSVRIDAFAYDTGGKDRNWWRGKVGDLLTCTFCLGFWISAVVYFAYLGATVGIDGIENTAWALHVINVFAIAGGQAYFNSRINA